MGQPDTAQTIAPTNKPRTIQASPRCGRGTLCGSTPGPEPEYVLLRERALSPLGFLLLGLALRRQVLVQSHQINDSTGRKAASTVI